MSRQPQNIEQVHRDGFIADDIVSVGKNVVLLVPIYPPESIGAIKLPSTSLEGAGCLYFRVVLKGDVDLQTVPAGLSPLRVSVGDVVIPRHAMLDPMGPRPCRMFAAATWHLLAVVDGACTLPPEQADHVPLELVASPGG